MSQLNINSIDKSIGYNDIQVKRNIFRILKDKKYFNKKYRLSAKNTLHGLDGSYYDVEFEKFKKSCK